MTIEYNNLITKSFRDDAIKSVLLIDDEYIPYEKSISDLYDLNKRLNELCDSARSGQVDLHSSLSELNLDLKQSDLARDIKAYFNNLSIVCDIENTTKTLDSDKIRKSDLIGLDYLLENNQPLLSLKLISELSNNKHINIVVLYTNEDLDKTWLEVAACLRGFQTEDPYDLYQDKEWYDEWDDFTKDYIEQGLTVDKKTLVDYILNGKMGGLNRAITPFSVRGNARPKERVLRCFMEIQLRNLCRANKDLGSHGDHIYGQFDKKSCMWLQAGNVFITFVSKNQDSVIKELVKIHKYKMHNPVSLRTQEPLRNITLLADKQKVPFLFTPNKIWKQIESSLHDWRPSAYRIIASELQNRIENGSLAVGTPNNKNDLQEAAILWNLLNTRIESVDEASSKLLSLMLEDISDDFHNEESDSFLDFIKRTALSVSDDIPEYVEPSREDEQAQKYSEYIDKLFKIARENTYGAQCALGSDFDSRLVHALNEELSTSNRLPDHITTGVILYDKDDEKCDSWYLCVTPSCNSVPGQDTDTITKEIKPLRQQTLLRLKKVKYRRELSRATDSKSIFITAFDEPLAFQVVDPTTSLPIIEKVIVLDHDTIPMTPENGKKVCFSINKGGKPEFIEKTLLPVAFLRPAYAARYQNFQSHYEGRIGVDFVSLSK